MSEIEYLITQSFHARTHAHKHTHTASLQRWTVLTKQGGSRYKERRSGMGSGARLRRIRLFFFAHSI